MSIMLTGTAEGKTARQHDEHRQIIYAGYA